MLLMNSYDSIDAIKDFLNLANLDVCSNVESLYHHNKKYPSMYRVLDEGLLSKRMQYLTKGSQIPSDMIEKSQDEFSTGALDYICVSQPDMVDLYINELEYDSRDPHFVDILLPSSLEAFRYTVNYGNEFLVKDRIKTSSFQAIDIRLLKLIKKYEDGIYNLDGKEQSLLEIIKNYNQLRIIATKMLENNLDIPLREVSQYGVDLDKSIVSQFPSIVLKR